MTDHEIRQRCAAAGFQVREITLRDGLLLLAPEDLDDLPDTGAFGSLAEGLRSGSVRWVTLDLREPT